MHFFSSRQHSTHQNLSDYSLFYRCQVIALVNTCQNKFRLFDQFTWQKKMSAMQSKKISTLIRYASVDSSAKHAGFYIDFVVISSTRFDFYKIQVHRHFCSTNLPHRFAHNYEFGNKNPLFGSKTNY